MSKVNPLTDINELSKRRNPKWVIDPATVTKEEQNRLIRWAHAKASKYEEKMIFEIPNGAIIASGDVEPEEPDIGSIYRFPDLHWILFRDRHTFAFQLFSRKLALLKILFARV